MKKIVTCGEVLVEIMAERRGQDFLSPGPLRGPFPSGAPAIFAGQAARLGQPVGLIGAVGRDDFGTLVQTRLRDWGVDLSALAVHPDLPTGSAFVTYRPDGSRQFIFNIRHSAAGSVIFDAAADRLAGEADHFHIMGSSLFSDQALTVALRGIETVKGKGGTVSFDPNIRSEMMERPGMRQALTKILGMTDLFLPSGDELFLFCQSTNEKEGSAELLARGVQSVVLKRGAAGARYYDRQMSLDVGAFPVEEVDPTGAGDCFGAAFVSLWLRGEDPSQALRVAAACGALAVTRKGPMEGIFTLDEVTAFLQRHGGSVCVRREGKED